MGSCMPRSRALALLVFLAAACGEAEPALDWPRLTDETGIDLVLLERIRSAESACARGEDGSWLELAMVYDANDLNQLAVRTYEFCLHLPADKAGASRSALQYQRARALDDLGRAEDALRAYDTALELEDAYAPARWRRGQLLLDAGRVAEARADFERAIALDPSSTPAHLGLARVLLVQDEPELAQAKLLAVLARAPNERFVHGLLARALLALGDEQGAEKELALEEQSSGGSGSDPLAAEVRKRATGIQVGVLYATEALKADRPGEAIKILRPLYRKVPDDLALLQVFSRSLVTAGEYERALEVLARGCRVHPEDGKLELFAGLALKGKGSLGEALVRLERARALNPSFPPTLTALGEVWIALGRFPEAEESLARARECGDDELSTLLLLGQSQMHQSAWTRAIATFERACSQSPASGLAWTHLAEAQAQAGDVPAAERSLAEATQRTPGSKRIEAVRRLLAARDPAR